MASTVLAVLLLVLLLARGPENCCGADSPPRGCTYDTEILHPWHEEIIQTTNGGKWYDSITAYVFLDTGFEGVRGEMETNTGTLTAWFPIKNRCHLDGSRWWVISLEVQKGSSSQVTLTLKVNKCKLTCEMSIDSKPGSSNNLILGGLTLFGRGPSWWRNHRPDNPCRVGDISLLHVSSISLPSCTEPPRQTLNRTTPTAPPAAHPRAPATAPNTALATASATTPATAPTTIPATAPATTPATTPATPPSPSESSAEETGVLTPTVLVVVVFVVIVVVVVFVMVMRRRKQQQNVAESQMLEPGQEIHASTNSLYEPFDKYQQDFITAGQGKAPQPGQEIHASTNSLYEPFDKYQQDLVTAGQGKSPHGSHNCY